MVNGDGVRSEGLVYVYVSTEVSEIVAFFETLSQFVTHWGCQNLVIFGGFNTMLTS